MKCKCLCVLYSLVADVVLFNSRFNRDSFLNNINSFLHTMPDCRPRGVREQLQDKCHVLYFPVQFGDNVLCFPGQSVNDVTSLDCELSTSTIAECGDGDICQPSEESSCITDSSIDSASTACDTVACADSSCDVDKGRIDTIADTNADVSSAVSLSAGSASIQWPVLQGDSDALHIVWPHRWYVRCYQ